MTTDLHDESFNRLLDRIFGKPFNDMEDCKKVLETFNGVKPMPNKSIHNESGEKLDKPRSTIPQ